MSGIVAAMSCQSVEARAPAVLERADAESLTRVRASLAAALDRGRVELGPGDLSASPAFTVLPPPLGSHEDRSTALPIAFALAMRGGSCIAVRADSGAEVALPGVACRPYVSSPG